MQMGDDEDWESVQVFADYIDPQPKWTVEMICQIEEPIRAGVLPMLPLPRRHTLALAFHGGDATGAPLMLISTSEAATDAVDNEAGDGGKGGVACWNLSRKVLTEWSAGDRQPLTQPDCHLSTPPGACVAVATKGGRLFLAGHPTRDTTAANHNVMPWQALQLMQASLHQSFVEKNSWALAVTIGKPLE